MEKENLFRLFNILVRESVNICYGVREQDDNRLLGENIFCGSSYA